MPWPKQIVSGDGSFVIDKDFTVSLQENTSKRVYNASTRFIRRLTSKTGVFLDEGFPKNLDTEASLQIYFKRKGKLELHEDESYTVEVTPTKIKLEANTDIGILRGLETILQLVQFNTNHFYIPVIKITDTPRFPWRGLMIDVARHYQPIHVLKRNLDAMAMVKLNVFHWHLTDDQGFRIESKTHPKLHELGSDGEYYTQHEIKEIIQYAKDRGIRVLPEFDVPGHATAILTAYPEIGSKDTTYQIERHAGIFDPTLDPTNEKTYKILSDVFGEIASLFPDEYIHIGGDENEGKHWDQNKDIEAFKKKHDIKTNHALQTHFNVRLQEILSSYNKKMMGWEEIISSDIKNSAIIHSWRGVNEGLPPGQSLIQAVKLGYKAVLSNGYYVDLMLPIEEHYLVDPIPDSDKLTDEQEKFILGGEATMWGELVTPLTIDSRIWPRTAAIAERFWSSKEINDIESMHSRLNAINLDLEQLGITHKRNRDVVLRNIVKTDNISAIAELTKVCEPLKKYTRNKDGLEYRSYSPFTLFADACTSDASDAKAFNILADKLAHQKTGGKTIIEISNYLQKWSLLYAEIEDFDNPIINEIKPLAENLSAISFILIDFIKNGRITSYQEEMLEQYLEKAKIPVVDVELMVAESFEKLIKYLNNNKKSVGN
ncbi:family 20 glycosylhydrolase [Aquimarina sp. MMG016]|nr:family 20 glycosylhydrolase [Aquimarina sp. MMG016]